MNDYEALQLARDRRLTSTTASQLNALFEGIHRWLGDEIAALNGKACDLEAQAKDADSKRAMEDMQYRFHAMSGQLARNRRRISNITDEIYQDDPGFGDPLHQFYDLADEIVLLQGMMRVLMDLRLYLGKMIEQLP